MDNFYGKEDDFPKRIREVIDMIGSPSAAARMAKVTPSSVNRWLKGESDPSRTNLVSLAKAADVNIEWLATGGGEKQKSLSGIQNVMPVLQGSNNCEDTHGNPINIGDFVFIPRYAIEAAAGNGYYVEDESVSYAVAFRRFWVEHYLHANPKDLTCISVKGDSMEGILNERDLILVNHAKCSPGNGLYVIRMGTDLIVKRTQTMPNNRLLVTSSNEAYAPFEIDLSMGMEEISIVGKVEWYGRQV